MRQRRQRERSCARRSRRAYLGLVQPAARPGFPTRIGLAAGGRDRRGGLRSTLPVFAPDASAALDEAARRTRRVWFDGGCRDTTHLVAARPAGSARSRGQPPFLRQGDTPSPNIERRGSSARSMPSEICWWGVLMRQSGNFTDVRRRIGLEGPPRSRLSSQSICKDLLAVEPQQVVLG